MQNVCSLAMQNKKKHKKHSKIAILKHADKKTNKKTNNSIATDFGKFSGVSIGVDIVQIARIEQILAKHKDAFLKRFLRKSEIGLLESKGFAPASVAGFFASKEACSKALGVGISQNLGFRDMILSYSSTKAPQIALSKRAKKFFGEKIFALSISHDGGFAIAVVCAYSF